MTNKELSLDDVRQQIGRHEWFHAIQLAEGLATRGRRPNNDTLFPAYWLLRNLDVHGADCLDLGCMDGLMSLILEQRGAATITATDIWDKPSMRLMLDYFHSGVSYQPGLFIEDIPERLDCRDGGRFDLLVFAGVLYHLFDPLAGVITCRKLIRPGGLLLLESHVRDGDGPTMVFTPGLRQDVYNEPTTFWLPTPTCVDEMLRLACFEPLARARFADRYTVMARAVKPSQITDAPPWLYVTHAAMAQAVARRYLDVERYEKNNPSGRMMDYPREERLREIRTPHTDEVQAAFLKAVAKAAADGAKKVALYTTPAEARVFGQLINRQRMQSLGLRFVAAFVDADTTAGGGGAGIKEVQGLPIIAIEEAHQQGIDAVVIASATHQERMRGGCAATGNAALQIYPLFEPIPLPTLEPLPRSGHPLVF